ncbi:hypothetical protein B0T18DRAFT_17656 [Schizothecium vesticola]|uniref:Uncharacterized protein n=1 Tax=Schizothecium vesticola TaxID=314040 RepID=A0AA40KBX4_9PEZI|nr:hypothetical protein B0T18DRAFT_17656 [Schizothecium vesticola]
MSLNAHNYVQNGREVETEDDTIRVSPSPYAGRRVNHPGPTTSSCRYRPLPPGGTSLKSLANMLRGVWLAGARRPAMALHFHAAKGREITVVDRMNLHLLWTSGQVREIPREAYLRAFFLIHPLPEKPPAS